ncbi:hypothetical protein M405DRAFT_695926, partial [Rhizopogon salebrosus TDB-379]
MVSATCLLLILSTLHMGGSISHVWQGFISSENADLFFDDVSKTTFKAIINELLTIIGDAILIYRCYVVWRRIDIIIIPIIGSIVYLVTGTYAVWMLSQTTLTNANLVFLQEMRKWVISAYTMALATNVIATSILALKLWLVYRRSSKIRVTRSQIYPVLLIVMESGALYSVSLVAMLATYLSSSPDSSYIVLDMICQIVPITFSLIIVRTAMLRFSEKTGQGLFTSTVTGTGPSNRLPSTRPMAVHIGRM